MAKPDRDSYLHQGEALLTDWGIAGDANAGALRPHALRMPSADLAIAARLGGQASSDSVSLLHDIDARSQDKLVRKEVKRALYRLEQRGMTIPAAAPTPATAAVLGPQIEGYLSPVDGHGDQLLWLVRATPGGVAHLLAVINDPEGMREADLSRTTRKALRQGRQELEAKHEIRMIEADWHYCDFLMDRAFRWAQERGAAVQGDYPGLRGQLVRTPAPTEWAPPILSRLDATAVRNDSAALAESPLLSQEKEFRTWFFPPEALQPYLEEMIQVKDSPLVLNPAQQQERFLATVEGAVEQLFGGAHQQSWVRRLHMMAFYFSATNRPDAARRACAVALALEASQRGGRDIPLCEQLVRGSLAAFFQMATEREKEREQSSIIVTPQQAAAEVERRRRR